MTKEQILALIKKGSVTVTGLLKGEEVTSEHIKEMDKKQFYENYVGHTDVYDLDKDKKEEGKEPEGKTEENPTVEPGGSGTGKGPEPIVDPEHPNTDNNDSKQDAGQAGNGGKSSQEGNTGGSTMPVPKDEPHVMPKDDKPIVDDKKPGLDKEEEPTTTQPKKPAATGKAKKPTTSK